METARVLRGLVKKYYDSDAAKPHWCTVFGSWSSRGKNFLKSEQGYIIKLDVPKYYFGFGKYEADDH